MNSETLSLLNNTVSQPNSELATAELATAELTTAELGPHKLATAELAKYEVTELDEGEVCTRQLLSSGQYNILLALLAKYSYGYRQMLPLMVADVGFLQAMFTAIKQYPYPVYQIARQYITSAELRQAMMTYTPKEQLTNLIRRLDALRYPDVRQAYIVSADTNELFTEALLHADSYPDLMQALLAALQTGQRRLSELTSTTLEEGLSQALEDGAEFISGPNNTYQQAIKQMLAAGLDPNMKIGDQALFLVTLTVHNYGVAEHLLSLSHLNDSQCSADFLLVLDAQLQPLTRMRDKIIQRQG